MTDSTLIPISRGPRRFLALAILMASVAMTAGCTGEPAPTETPADTVSAASTNPKDATAKVPGKKGDLMEGIPKK